MVKSSTPALDLRIDWASHDAAKFASTHWHYSKSMPLPPLVKVGVWECQKFIGVVIFSRGASNTLLKPYGLNQDEGCELTRIALKNHVAPVSKIISIALKFLKQNSPKLRLVVSFADPTYGHSGIVYQASNWLYAGTTAPSKEYFKNGKRLHNRQVSAKGYEIQFGKKIKTPKPSECIVKVTDGKYRYLMALDESMKEKILPLSKPYPKRAKGQDAGHHPTLGGSTPTCALQIV